MQTHAKTDVSAGSFWSVRSIGLLALLFVFMLGMMTTAGNAQATSGTILGTVTDASGAVVGNTTVQLISAGTGVKTTAVTNGSGYYQFVDVIPGTYKLIIAKEGFKQLSRAGIVLQTEARIQVDLQLTVGASSETIEVTASTPLIEADNVSLGTVVDERETNELPLNGRNPMNLTALVASVIPLGETSGSPTGNNPMAWGNYQIGGGMAGQSSTYIDGSPDNGIYDHNTEIIPSQDSIAEFKVETNNMGAEYGRLAGGVINFVTKSGTKDIHGSTWEFIRNKIFNANTYGGNNAGLARAPFTQNQYGANFGGPVFIPHVYDGKKKTFFFVNWEGFGLRQGVPYVTTVPTTAELGGDLTRFNHTMFDPTTTCENPAGCNVGDAIPYYTTGPGAGTSHGTEYVDALNQNDREPIGWEGGNTLATATPANTSVFQSTTADASNYINPTSLAYMKKMYPTATGELTAQGNNNYTANASSGGNNYQFVTHIDHDMSDHQHISGRYTWWDNINLAADPLKDGMCGQGECGEVYRMHNFILDDTYTLSAKTILDTRLSYNRYGYVRTPKVLWGTSDITSIGWPSAYSALVEFPGPPVFDVGSWDSAGLFSGQGADSTIIDYQDTYRLASTLTRFVGNHTLKFGAEFTMQKFNYAQTNTSAGLWNFSQGTTANTANSSANDYDKTTGIDAASYLLGYSSGGSSSYADLIAAESNYPAAFITDDWRATQKLTFHVGVRWENTLPFTERHNRISFFDPNANNDVMAGAGITVKGNASLVGTSERPSRYGINPDNMEFSPRFGASYRVRPNTVINAGFGIFWLPNDVTLSQNPGWDGDGASSTPYTYSTENGGYYPTNSISTPWPLATPGDATSAYLILPAGHNLAAFQTDEIGNGPTILFPNTNWAYTEQWNFGVQQQLGKSTAIDVSYAGASGTHLPAGGGWFSMDALPDSYLAGQASCTKGTDCLTDQIDNPYFISGKIPAGHGYSSDSYSRGHSYTPFPEYSGLSTPADVASSDYHALEVKIQKRFAQGASVNVAYTFSKFQSDTDTLNTWLENVTGIGDVNNMKHEKSLSSNDAPQRLVISYVYDIPVGRGKTLLPNINRAADLVIGGWGLQGLTTLMKGFPIGISENNGGSIGTTNNGNSRPDQVQGCSKNISGSAVKKLGGWYNTACFTESTPFVWGNENRNDSTLEAPGVANWDMSIVKKFSVTEDGRVNMQFRTEFFNLFNRVQFGYPNGNFDAPTGAATISPAGYNTPRTVQFALRVNF